MTTTLYTLAFPHMERTDDLQVRCLRIRYDPNYKNIASHMTLVFATSLLAEHEYVKHIKSIARNFNPFTVLLDRAERVQSHVEPSTHHLFLTASEDAVLRDLHDKLYSGALEPALRRDIPFVPHMTIGAFSNAKGADDAASHLNRIDFSFKADVGSLSIVADAGGSYRRVEDIAL